MVVKGGPIFETMRTSANTQPRFVSVVLDVVGDLQAWRDIPDSVSVFLEAMPQASRGPLKGAMS